VSGVKGTIKPAGEIAALFKTAGKLHTESVMALIQRTDDSRGHKGRVAFIAGKKLGSAPVRNRAKRQMREAARDLRAPWAGYDIIFVAKISIIDSNYASIMRDMEIIYQSLSKTEER
jgi:ribonuclease P protein component